MKRKIILLLLLINSVLMFGQITPLSYNGGFLSNPSSYVEYNGRLYFSANNPATGNKAMFSMDASETIQLEWNVPGNDVRQIIVYQNEIYLTFSSGTTNPTLVQYQGNGGGSVQIADISIFGELVAFSDSTFGERLYFSGENQSAGAPATGPELYAYDGTSATLIADQVLGADGLAPSQFEIHDGRLYFTGFVSTGNYGVYSSDGNVVQFVSSGFGINEIPKESFNGQLYYVNITSNDLLSFDYSTSIETNIFNGSLDVAAIFNLEKLDNKLILGIKNPSETNYQPTLLNASGVLESIAFENLASAENYIYTLGVFGNRAFIRGSSTTFGSELYEYEVSENNTKLVEDYNPGNDNSTAGGEGIIEFNGNVYMDARSSNTSGLVLVVYKKAAVQTTTTIEDDAFEAYLEDIGAGDGIASNDLVNLTAVQNVTILNMAGGFNGQQIQSLAGIEAFSILETLEVSNNQLTDLPLASNNSLVSLKANNNQIASVAFSNPSSLEIIELNSNNLSSIDLSNLSGSEVLLLNENSLTSIDFSSTPGLEVVDVGDNLLTALDITNMAPILNTLNFSLNQIPSINLSTAAALSSLTAFESGLTALDLSNLSFGQLATINVNLNQGLSCIEVSNVASAEQEVTNGNWFVDPIPGLFKLDCSAANCTTVSISDVNFEAYLEDPANTFFDALGNQVFPSDGIANNNLVCLDAIALIDELDIDGTISTVDIVSFDGIANFSALTKFKLRVTPTALTAIDFSANGTLIEIDISDTLLETLIFPTNKASLQKVTLSQNNFSGGIDLSGYTALTEIQAILSSFSTVNTTNCTALQILNFDNGSISALDLSTNTNLRELILDATPITDLELTGGVYPNLTSIVVARSNIENLTIRNTAITSINLNEMNNLKLVDIEENILLKTVSMNNPGTEPTNIERLSLRANDLTGTLDIANIPGITTIDVSSNPNLIVLDVTNQVNLEFLATFGSGITTLDLSTNNGTLSELNLGTPAVQSNLLSLNLLNPTNNFTYTNFGVFTDNNPNLNCIQVHSTFDAEEAVNQGFWSVENVPAIFNVDCTGTAVALVQFQQSASSGFEVENSNLPQLLINGTVTNASTVTLEDLTNGTATPSTTTSNGDYIFNGGTITYTITIPAGVYDGTTPFSLPDFEILDDFTFENDETLNLQITGVTGDLAIGITADTQYTIREDDYIVGIVADDSEASEAGDTGSFAIGLFDDTGSIVTNNTGGDLFISFGYSGTASASDFNSSTSGVFIPQGDDSVIIPITAVDDSLVEGSETIICTLIQGVNYKLDNSKPQTDVITILDNDSGNPTTFEAEVQVVTDILNTTNVNEGNTEIELQMFIPNADTDNLLLDFDIEIVEMTATADTDFSAIPANETFSYEYFNDGLTLYNISVLQDGLLESNEQFIIRISNPSDSRVQLKNANANGVLEFVITILDNETANAVLTSKDGIEGGNIEFTVRLQDDNGNPITNNTGSDINFDIVLTDGTAMSPADYTNLGANAVVTVGNFAAGGFIEVPLLDDTDAETEENFSASISNPSFAGITITQATTTANIAASDNTDGDSDSDGVLDATDNCPNTPNANQADLDADGEGDVCDMDRDGDGVLNVDDTCPDLAGVAANNGCPQSDSDGDGILDATDNCINTANADQLDTDGDGIGDLCDTDIDGDGVPNTNDNCIMNANPGQEDADNDGIGDVCDTPGTTTDLILNPEDLSIIVQAESCPDVPNGSLVVGTAVVDQDFTVTIAGSNLATPLQGSFNSSTLFFTENLAAGAYDVCITAAAYPAFEQCYVANVLNSNNISVVSQSLDLSAKTALFSVEGSTKYTVQVNTEIYQYDFDTTKERLIEVPMEDGQNQIQITGASECQGIFKDAIFLGKVTAYPNPVVDTLHLSGISGSESSEISIVNLSGTVVRRELKNSASGGITINVSELSSGLYVIYVKNAAQNSTFKIIKK